MITVYVLASAAVHAVQYLLLVTLEHNTFFGFNRINRRDSEREKELLKIINDLSSRVSDLETVVNTTVQIEDQLADKMDSK